MSGQGTDGLVEPVPVEVTVRPCQLAGETVALGELGFLSGPTAG
jgi:hypothetical protein